MGDPSILRHPLTPALPSCSATLSTVGYGDVTPITWPGKLIGGAAAVLAVGLFGLPAGILSDGFKEMAEQRRARLAWMERVVAAFQRKYAKRVAMKRWFLHGASSRMHACTCSHACALTHTHVPACTLAFARIAPRRRLPNRSVSVLRDRCQREWVLYSDGDEDVVEWHPYSRHGTAHGGPKAPKMGARMPAAKPFVIATGVRDVPIVLRPFDAPSERSVRLTERRIAQRRGPGHSDHDHDRDHNHRNHHDHRGHARHRDHPFDENGRDESGEPASSTGASEGELSSQPALERSAIGRKHRPRQPTGHGVRREMSVPSTCCGATMRVQVVVTMGEGGDAGVASPHSSGGENAGPPPSSEGENAGPSRSSEEAPLRRGVAIDSRSSRGDPDDERPARAVADLPFGISEEDVLQYAARGAGGAITP